MDLTGDLIGLPEEINRESFVYAPNDILDVFIDSKINAFPVTKLSFMRQHSSDPIVFCLGGRIFKLMFCVTSEYDSESQRYHLKLYVKMIPVIRSNYKKLILHADIHTEDLFSSILYCIAIQQIAKRNQMSYHIEMKNKHLKLKLYDYQRNNIAWMARFENKHSMRRHNFCMHKYKTYLGVEYTEKFYGSNQMRHHVSGGIIADAPGAGKSVTCISHILEQYVNIKLDRYIPRLLNYVVLTLEDYDFVTHQITNREKAYLCGYCYFSESEFKKMYKYYFDGRDNQNYIYLDISNVYNLSRNERKKCDIDNPEKIRIVYPNVEKLIDCYYTQKILNKFSSKHSSSIYSYKYARRNVCATFDDFGGIDNLKRADIYRSYVIPTKATLIVCPNHVASHWIAQIKKCVNMSNKYGRKQIFKYVVIRTILDARKVSYLDILEADIVLITEKVFENKNFKAESKTCVSNYKFMLNVLIKKLKYFYKGIEPNYAHNDVLRNGDMLPFVDYHTNDIAGVKERLHNCKVPSVYNFLWQRVIFDEFQTYKDLRKRINIMAMRIYLHSRFRWLITATPNVIEKLNSSYVLNIEKFMFMTTLLNMDNVGEHLSFGETRFDETQFDETQDIIPRKQQFGFMTYHDDYNITWFTLMYSKFMAEFCHKSSAIQLECKLIRNVKKVVLTENERHLYSLNINSNIVELLQICANCDNLSSENIRTIEEIIESFKNAKYRAMTQMVKTYDLLQEEIANLRKQCSNIPSYKDTNNIEYYSELSKEQEPNSIAKANLGLLVRKLKKHDKIKNEYDESISHNEFTIKLMEIIEQMKDEKYEFECEICYNTYKRNEVSLLSCGHMYCTKCVETLFEYALNKEIKCPVCARVINKSGISKIHCFCNDNISDLSIKYGSKTALILNNIIDLISRGEKILLFSQWNVYDKRLNSILIKHGINVANLNGSVYRTTNEIMRFRTDPTVNVMLISNEGKNTGVELIEAKHVFIVSPFFGEDAIEQELQAITRTYRSGQTNDVYVTYYIAEDTIEEKVYDDLCIALRNNSEERSNE